MVNIPMVRAIWQRRQFDWISTRCADKAMLERLQNKLLAYYSLEKSRDQYQAMIDAAQTSQPTVLKLLTSSIADLNPKSILELGCGSGWILEHLKGMGVAEASYVGAELSGKVIARNRKRFPSAQWIHIQGYESGVERESFDVAFSYFVIEHCVYPERHLNELFSAVRPGGCVFLVCPEFVRGGIFPSQFLGVGGGNASTLVRRGRLFAALIGLYDSRLRIRKALRNLQTNWGHFVVNLQPRCIDEPDVYVPDVDAVYISNENDVKTWAMERNALVDFPGGSTDSFHSILFARIRKPS